MHSPGQLAARAPEARRPSTVRTGVKEFIAIGLGGFGGVSFQNVRLETDVLEVVSGRHFIQFLARIFHCHTVVCFSSGKVSAFNLKTLAIRRCN